MKSLLFLLLFFVLAMPTFLWAGGASHRAAVEELLAVSQADQMLEPMYQQLDSMLEQQFAKLAESKKDERILKKYRKRLVGLLRKEMKWEMMEADIVDLYVKVYTENEVKEITRFYRSPIGQKLIAKMPQVMNEAMAISQKNFQHLMPKIQRISREMAEALDQKKQRK